VAIKVCIFNGPKMFILVMVSSRLRIILVDIEIAIGFAKFNLEDLRSWYLRQVKN
jgi:hypothetical protein